MGLYAERIFPWIMEHTDTPELRSERRRVLARARGRVLEIGAGAGATFTHYGGETGRVISVEPSAGMNRRARRKAGAARVQVRLVAGDAERLPFRDSAFDTVVAVLVLCSIPDPDRALAEAARVLAPGGRFLFLEHVRAPDPAVERWQRRIQPLWGRVACGCHLARDTESRLLDAGFAIEDVDRFWLPRAPRLMGRMIRGVASPA